MTNVTYLGIAKKKYLSLSLICQALVPGPQSVTIQKEQDSKCHIHKVWLQHQMIGIFDLVLYHHLCEVHLDVEKEGHRNGNWVGFISQWMETAIDIPIAKYLTSTREIIEAVKFLRVKRYKYRQLQWPRGNLKSVVHFSNSIVSYEVVFRVQEETPPWPS